VGARAIVCGLPFDIPTGHNKVRPLRKMSDGLDLVLPLGEAAETFQLEKAVCSHGLFMMAPNQWDPLSKTLLRPTPNLSPCPRLPTPLGPSLSPSPHLRHPLPLHNSSTITAGTLYSLFLVWIDSSGWVMGIIVIEINL
jgi:hypothetical protein